MHVQELFWILIYTFSLLNKVYFGVLDDFLKYYSETIEKILGLKNGAEYKLLSYSSKSNKRVIDIGNNRNRSQTALAIGRPVFQSCIRYIACFGVAGRRPAKLFTDLAVEHQGFLVCCTYSYVSNKRSPTIILLGKIFQALRSYVLNNLRL